MEEHDIKIENENDGFQCVFSEDLLLHSENLKKDYIGTNISEEYFTVKEEPLNPNLEPIDQKPFTPFVYTTKIDDMTFMTRHVSCYKKMLKGIERQSKPKYKPGCILHKRIPSISKYYIMHGKIQLALQYKKAEEERFQAKNHKKQLSLCRPMSVVIERLDIAQIASHPLNALKFDRNQPNIQCAMNFEPIDEIKKEEPEEQPENNVEIVEIYDNAQMQLTATNTNISSHSQRGSVSLTKRDLEKHNLGAFTRNCHCCIFLQDAYSNKNVICGVNKRGHTVFQLESSSVLNSTVLNSIGTSSKAISVNSCCWYKLFEKLNEGWCIYFRHNNSANSFDPFTKTPPFVLRPHQCRPITCQCCCKKKNNRRENNNVVIMNSKNEFSTTMSQNAEKKESFSSTIPRYIIGIANKSSSFLSKTPITLDTTKKKTDLSYQRQMMLCFKNIESYQGEFYYFNVDGTLASYYIIWYKASFPLISKLVSGCSNDNIVCCWAKREQAISFFVTKYRIISPAVVRFIKRFHACEYQNCKCCCKHKLKKPVKMLSLNLKPLFLPKIRKHTIQHRAIKNFPTNVIESQDSEKKSQSLQKAQSRTMPVLLVGGYTNSGVVQVPQFATIPVVINSDANTCNLFPIASASVSTMPVLSSAPGLSTKTQLFMPNPSNLLGSIQSVEEHKQTVNKIPENAINTTKTKTKAKIRKKSNQNIQLSSTNNKLLEEQTSIYITILPESLKESVLTVDINRKVAATLPVPITSLCTDSLKILSNILKRAQEQIDTLKLPPGTKLNIKVATTPVPKKPVSPITPVVVSKKDNESVLLDLYKSFTSTAVLKSKYYKNCLNKKKNMTPFTKASDSEPRNVSTQINAIPGPSGIVKNVQKQKIKNPQQFQSQIAENNNSLLNNSLTQSDRTEMGTIIPNNLSEFSQVDLKEEMCPEGPEIDYQDSDDYAELVYDEDEQDIEMKPVLNDDIIIEENTLFDNTCSTSEMHNNECILGA